MYRKCLSFIFTILLLLTLCSCESYAEYFKDKNYPAYQQGTEWATDDGAVSFSVPENRYAPVIGTILTDDGPVSFQIHWGDTIGSTNYITYTIIDYSDPEAVVAPEEEWKTKIVKKDKFVVEVSEEYFESRYFEPGDRLVFYKIQ